MNLFNRKKKGNKSRGNTFAPSHDPYGRYKNDGSGIFGFRKDKHVIMPGVTSYEERRLKKVKDYVTKETNQECTLPQELINDVYSMYVNKDVKRRPKDKSNTIRHKVLDKVYNSLTKTVTIDSPLFTQILTRELALVLQKIEDEIKEEQEKNGGEGEGFSEEEGQGEGEGEGDGDGNPEDGNGDSEAGKGDGSGDRDSYQDAIDKILDKADSSIQKAMDKADDKIQKLEDQLGKEAVKDLADSEPEFLEKIDGLKHALSKVAISKESIGKVLEKILNESQNYFSKKFKRVEESLFDCEECEDLFGLEFLHPIFKNSQLMEVGNETRIYKGKIDLFLDCSGSMSSTANFEGTTLRMSDLVKGIAMVLFRLGMIENLYFFDTNLYQIKNVNELTILSFSKSGGTNFERVIAKVKENGNNAVVITDGEDNCSTYDKKVFWVGVGGTRFNGYGNGDDNAFKLYRSMKQCVTYNSRTSKFDYCTQKESTGYY